jgi:DNA invertase Pin-like site-specific DNA recombinase
MWRFSVTRRPAQRFRGMAWNRSRRLRRGEIARVVVFKLDRLGRSLTHLALILDEFTRNGVSLICTSQGIDTSCDNPVGRLQLNVLIAVAQFEREIIRERVKAGVQAARARGVKLGRPNSIERHRAEVLDLRRTGLGIRAIARKLGIAPASVSKLAL